VKVFILGVAWWHGVAWRGWRSSPRSSTFLIGLTLDYYWIGRNSHVPVTAFFFISPSHARNAASNYRVCALLCLSPFLTSQAGQATHGPSIGTDG
jgi:hypothetical protein